MTNKLTVPTFVVTKKKTDIGTQVRIQQINNGYVVRTGENPIFYPDLNSAAEAIKSGLLAANWQNPKELK